MPDCACWLAGSLAHWLAGYLPIPSLVGAKRQQQRASSVQRPAPSAQCPAIEYVSNPAVRPAPNTQHPGQHPASHQASPVAAAAGVGWGPDRDWTAEWTAATHTARRNSWPARTDIAIARGSPAASGALPAPVQSKIGTDSRVCMA